MSRLFDCQRVPIVFANMDIGSKGGRELFEKLSIRSGPTVVLAPPTMRPKVHESIPLFEKLQTKYRYKSVYSASSTDISAFIHRMTGIDLRIVIDDSVPIMSFVVLIGTVAAAAHILILFHLKILHFVRTNPPLFFVLFCVFFLFCITGGNYNRIRHADLLRRDANGDLLFILPAPRDQLALESWIVAVFYVVCGVMAVCLVEGAFDYREAARGALDMSRSKRSSTVPGVAVAGPPAPALVHKLTELRVHAQSIAAVMSPALCLVLLSFSFVQLSIIYTKKNPAYLGHVISGISL